MKKLALHENVLITGANKGIGLKSAKQHGSTGYFIIPGMQGYKKREPML